MYIYVAKLKNVEKADVREQAVTPGPSFLDHARERDLQERLLIRNQQKHLQQTTFTL